MLALFAIAAFITACGDGASSDNQSLPDAAAPVVCVPGAQIACACLNGHQGVQVCDEAGKGYKPCDCPAVSDAGQDVVTEAEGDAESDAEADVPAKKTCILKKDVDLGPGDTNITSAASQDSFAVGLCQPMDHCDLIIMGKDEGPVTIATIGGGEYGFLTYGAPHGYLVSFSAMADAGLKYKTAFVDEKGSVSLEGEVPSGFSFGLAPSADGGYWLSENSIGELLPQGNTSTASIHYMSPKGVMGNAITLAQNTKPALGQNQVVGLATLGQTVAASIATAADDGKRNTAVFLVQPDNTITKVVLDTYIAGYDVTEVHSAPGWIFAQGNRFAFEWSMMSDPYWKYFVTYMDPDGSHLETIELPNGQTITSVGGSLAGVENDPQNLKIKLTLYDEKLQPISDPLVVADGVKTYYMNSPVARATSSDEIMVAYTSAVPDQLYHIRAAFISCQ
jgi:hypothetical protein